MKKTQVLFVCIHNSARSQMAQAFLNTIAGDRFIAESAGIEAGVLNPLAVEAMAEVGIDISQNTTRRAFDLLKSGRHFQYVITVCDAVNAQKCPVFPGAIQHIHWSFPDPAQLQGTHDEKMKEVRKIRDSIKEKIEWWISETKAGKDPEIEIPPFKFGV
ncbi:MAG TPA: arsenate reductase ArsC [Thermodesulfovibrionales bacterium]|nr:arsenate reductase ArsC [Thermodesulfovibrionales bacterium]